MSTEECLVSEFADEPGMEELIQDFLLGLESTCEELVQGLSAGDFDKVRRLAHQMKGAGGGYGFPLLTKVGLDLEQAIKADNDATERVRSAAKEFTRTCRRAMLGLSKQSTNGLVRQPV